MARTANVETETTQDTAEKKALSTQVSFNFGTAVRNKAEAEGTTISGYIAGLVYNLLDLDLPEADKAASKSQTDKISLSAIIPTDVKLAFDEYADGEGKTTSRALQELLADAVEYDLSKEPKIDRGAALRAAHEKRKAVSTKQSKTIDALTALLRELMPDKVDSVLASIESED